MLKRLECRLRGHDEGPWLPQPGPERLGHAVEMQTCLRCGYWRTRPMTHKGKAILARLGDLQGLLRDIAEGKAAAAQLMAFLIGGGAPSAPEVKPLVDTIRTAMDASELLLETHPELADDVRVVRDALAKLTEHTAV